MKTLIEGPGRMRVHTLLHPLYLALGNILRGHQWIVTDLETQTKPPHLMAGHAPEAQLLTDSQFAVLLELDDLQFIWGVFTAVDPARPIDLSRLPVKPWADGNRAVWDPDAGPQFPGASIEIVCFDTSATIVTTMDEAAHAKLRAYFPEARSMPPLKDRGVK